jgi:hypothetical protein
MSLIFFCFNVSLFKNQTPCQILSVMYKIGYNYGLLYIMEMWIGLYWLGTGSSDRILRPLKLTFRLHKREEFRNYLNDNLGRAVAQRLDAGFPPRRPGFAYGQHVGFVADKAALGQFFSEYFGFPCQSFHRFLPYHNHPGLTQ